MRWITAIAVLLVAVVSCNDDPTSVVINQPVDTLVVFHTDTVVTFHTDTIVDIVLVYCWLVDENKGHPDPPIFHCDNGYQGPRI